MTKKVKTSVSPLESIEVVKEMEKTKMTIDTTKEIKLEDGTTVIATPIVIYGHPRMKYEKDGCTFIVFDRGDGVYVV